VAELYTVVVSTVAPKRGRTHAVVSLQVVQRRFEGGFAKLYVDRWKQFAGRLLWDSEIPELRAGIEAPWEAGARFRHVTKAVLRDRVTHDLIRLVDHDRPGLARLIALTGNEELDPAVYEQSHGSSEWPHREEPSHYSNFLDEAVFDVSLGIELPTALVVGLSWSSAAF